MMVIAFSSQNCSFYMQKLHKKKIFIAFSIVWTIMKMGGRKKDTGKREKYHGKKEMWKCILHHFAPGEPHV